MVCSEVEILSLTVDDASLSWLEELAGHLSLLEQVIDCPVELPNLVLSSLCGPSGFDFKLMPAPAGENRVSLEFSENMIGIMTALRAFNRKLCLPGHV